MKLVDVSTRIDDETYAQIYSLSIEISADTLQDLKIVEYTHGVRALEGLVGLRMREILEELAQRCQFPTTNLPT